jgi:hypothetical protein
MRPMPSRPHRTTHTTLPPPTTAPIRTLAAHNGPSTSATSPTPHPPPPPPPHNSNASRAYYATRATPARRTDPREPNTTHRPRSESPPPTVPSYCLNRRGGSVWSHLALRRRPSRCHRWTSRSPESPSAAPHGGTRVITIAGVVTSTAGDADALARRVEVFTSPRTGTGRRRPSSPSELCSALHWEDGVRLLARVDGTRMWALPGSADCAGTAPAVNHCDAEEEGARVHLMIAVTSDGRKRGFGAISGIPPATGFPA